MAEIFGDFVEKEEGAVEYLKICFHPSALPLRLRWRNNGLSADFLADYLSTFFPGEDPASAARQAEIKDATSYIANELLENAMKFSYGSEDQQMSIEMFLDTGSVSLYTFNYVDPTKVKPFQMFLERLLSEDIGQLYIEQLELNAQDEDDDGSGLGFLTMLHDYGATLAWKFDEDSRNVATVTTMVKLYLQ